MSNVVIIAISGVVITTLITGYICYRAYDKVFGSDK